MRSNSWNTLGRKGPGIKMNLNGSYITSKDELFNPIKYNLPGSEYAVLECYEGEVLDVLCKGQGNKFVNNMNSKDEQELFVKLIMLNLVFQVKQK